MNDFDLLYLRRNIIENNIILLFEGKMSQGVLIALVDMLREKLNATEEASGDRLHYLARKLYAIFVELAQNIQNHSLEREVVGQTSIGCGIIVMREKAGFFTITSGNALLNSDADKLMHYCHYLNSLDGDGLKKLYKEKLRTTRRIGDKGAGIGLIEIMRKSDSLLETAIRKLDERSVFFSLSVNIAKGEFHG
ncbi:MAG: SiaB family protein kinase [Gammaproteobacteria bacterium]